MSKEELHAVLQRVIDRSHDQKLERIGQLRAELHELGYTIVTNEWLRIVFKQMTFEDMERIAREKAE